MVTISLFICLITILFKGDTETYRKFVSFASHSARRTIFLNSQRLVFNNFCIFCVFIKIQIFEQILLHNMALKMQQLQNAWRKGVIAERKLQDRPLWSPVSTMFTKVSCILLVQNFFGRKICYSAFKSEWSFYSFSAKDYFLSNRAYLEWLLGNDRAT